ncbi:hypothetical protein BS17DRAFT_764376 [Gyrodon lividus]|nr:hypothetical protein BS17DRAFT_764376 [Gyrodon lividus]
MTTPSHEPPEPQYDGPSPVDVPYDVSSSGHLVPYSPAPSRQHHIPWISGSQTSLHEQPNPIDTESLHSIQFRPVSSRSSIRAHEPNPMQSPDPPTHVSRTPSPLHRGVAVRGSSSLAIESSPTGRAAPDGFSAPAGHHNAVPNVDDLTQPGESTINYDGPRFAPMSAEGVTRHDRHNMSVPTDDDYKISAMLYKYPDTPDTIPQGWTAHRHPEGALYFMHGESKTLTEVNICNEEILGDIEYFRDFLKAEIEARVQLVLEPKADVIGVLCCYYFVNPRNRSLFWLDDWEGYEIFGDCEGALTPSHKGLGIQVQYWCAAAGKSQLWYSSSEELFFSSIHTPSSALTPLQAALGALPKYHLTSNQSPCPLNVDELKNHLSLIEKIEIDRRIMHRFCTNQKTFNFEAILNTGTDHHYFLNFHGERGARLHFDQTIYGWRYYPSLLMTVCAPLLFMAPVTNVRSLHKIFVDGIANRDKWNIFVNRLNSQLQDTNLLATVPLNANVGFLAIQSVDNGGGITLRQLSSYMSLVTSMASIVLGLAFVGHNRTETPLGSEMVRDQAPFLRRIQRKRHGLETLAIVYSLPYAFLMWG